MRTVPGIVPLALPCSVSAVPPPPMRCRCAAFLTVWLLVAGAPGARQALASRAMIVPEAALAAARPGDDARRFIDGILDPRHTPVARRAGRLSSDRARSCRSGIACIENEHKFSLLGPRIGLRSMLSDDWYVLRCLASLRRKVV